MKVYRPKNLANALEIKATENVIPFAGGTDLMIKYRTTLGVRPNFPYPVLFLNDITQLKQIKIENGNIIIGSANTLTTILKDDRIPDILRTAISNMAAVTIRNIATIGGNICNSSPAGDTLPPLYALDAKVALSSQKTKRIIPIQDFIIGPGQNILADNEILTEIIIPQDKFDVQYYRKVGTRKAMSLSKLSMVGLVNKNNGRISDIRIAFGAVAPTVVRSRQIEEEIISASEQKANSLIHDILSKYAKLIRPIDDQRSTAQYRKEISLKLLTHFLAEQI
ncbi:dehydrogenase [bacterium]|nr:MAG: dehydrogenase [bacterium]